MGQKMDQVIVTASDSYVEMGALTAEEMLEADIAEAVASEWTLLTDQKQEL